MSLGSCTNYTKPVEEAIPVNQFSKNLSKIISDDVKRHRLQFKLVSITLAIVSIVMTIMNFFTNKGFLTIATLAFSVLCIVNYLLTIGNNKKLFDVANVLFVLELMAIFVFFIISGNPEGFSAIWICMLPSCGMLMFGRKKTTILSSIMLIILLFFFQTETGQSFLMYNYTESFRMRFPVLFVSAFCISFVLETIYFYTHQELIQTRANLQEMYMHDYLTGALNRHGLNEIYEQTKPGKEQSVMMIDLDHFKMINDTYGHSVGDTVLKAVVQKINEMISHPLCRWGGEEFVVWFPEESIPDSLAENIRCAVKELPIVDEKGNTLNVTISIGIARGSDQDDMHDLIDIADEHLYKAKASGRDCVVS